VCWGSWVSHGHGHMNMRACIPCREEQEALGVLGSMGESWSWAHEHACLPCRDEQEALGVLGFMGESWPWAHEHACIHACHVGMNIKLRVCWGSCLSQKA
jgi:hypothetical protein